MNKKILAIVSFVILSIAIINASATTSTQITEVIELDNDFIAQKLTVVQNTLIATGENQPPETPIINGTTHGTIGVTYNYTFVTTDPDGDNVYYWIKWEPGCPSVNWIGPYPSDQVLTISHSFTQKGTYPISCQAKDIYNATSDIGSLTVTMSRSKSVNRPYFWLLQNFFENYPNLSSIIQKLLIKL